MKTVKIDMHFDSSQDAGRFLGGRRPLSVLTQPAGLLLIAVWFGLITGIGEVSLLATKKFFLDRVVFFWTPHVAWMVPLAGVSLFALPGFFLTLLFYRWPERISLCTVVFVFSFLSFLSGLFMYYPLHIYAKLLLAAGLATQAARFAARRPHILYAVVRRTTWWMVVLVAALALGMNGWELTSERYALARLPSAPIGAPNVLLIVMDTVRAQNLSLYDYARPTTPQLEQFAKSGIRFDRAISTSSWTLPSHGSMFTGRFPHELSTDWFAPLDTTYPTLAEFLSARGYLTAGFVANEKYASAAFGLNRGFTHYEDLLLSPERVIRSSSLGDTITGTLRRVLGYFEAVEEPSRKWASKLNYDFLRWLSKHNERPFFAFLNYFDAHHPYIPPKPFDVMFGSDKLRKNPILWHDWRGSASDTQAEIDAYDGAIAYLDHHLGFLFRELEHRGLLQNTLVIVTSDHGEEFGEHGLFIHGNGLYLPSLHVPLLISFPGRVPRGKSIREAVSLRDLPATIVGLLNLKSVSPIPGKSLARYWDDLRSAKHSGTDVLVSEVNFAPNLPDRYPVSKGNVTSLIIDHTHYIRNGDGKEEVYDFEKDPLEQQNLTSSQKGLQWLKRFRAALEKTI
jgi:arylsulfatase A-like enzyme